MQENGKSVHYFLSANTPSGFVSKLDRLYSGRDGWKAYILKGGPGTGKTEVIKKTGEAATSLGMDVEYIHCTSDCGSYDGLAVPALKACVLDGTPPHYVEPKYPGVVETIINLGDCWDENILAPEHDRIIMFAARIDAIYERACRFLAAADNLLSDTYRIALECCDQSKIDRYSTRIAKREFAPRRRQGRESVRFLTGLTPDGVVCFKNTVENLNRVYVIEDEFGIGRLLLNKIRNYALSAGYDVTACYCPTSPDEKLEHIIVPSLSIAFVTSNRYHRFDGKGFRHIHIRRFIDDENLKLRHSRITFNRKASRELLGEAVKLLGEMKSNYDMLKSIYSSATDFKAVDKKASELISKIMGKL